MRVYGCTGVYACVSVRVCAFVIADENVGVGPRELYSDQENEKVKNKKTKG